MPVACRKETFWMQLVAYHEVSGSRNVSRVPHNPPTKGSTIEVDFLVGVLMGLIEKPCILSYD